MIEQEFSPEEKAAVEQIVKDAIENQKKNEYAIEEAIIGISSEFGKHPVMLFAKILQDLNSDFSLMPIPIIESENWGKITSTLPHSGNDLYEFFVEVHNRADEPFESKLEIPNAIDPDLQRSGIWMNKSNTPESRSENAPLN